MRWLNRLLRSPLSVMVALALAPSGHTEVTAGAGAGHYTTGFGCGGGVLKAPYQEAGVNIRHESKDGLSAGLSGAVRDDDDGEIARPNDDPNVTVPEIRNGARWDISPWVGYRWKFLRGRVGLHGGDYYRVKVDQKGSPVLPRLAVGVEWRRLTLSLGLLDPIETMPIMTANGGIGLLGLRGELRLRRHDRATLGLTVVDNDTTVGASYLGAVAGNLLLGVGGFFGEYASGGMVVLGIGWDQ